MTDPKEPQETVVPDFTELFNILKQLGDELRIELRSLYPGTPVVLLHPTRTNAHVVRIEPDDTVTVAVDGTGERKTVPATALDLRDESDGQNQTKLR